MRKFYLFTLALLSAVGAWAEGDVQIIKSVPQTPISSISDISSEKIYLIKRTDKGFVIPVNANNLLAWSSVESLPLNTPLSETNVGRFFWKLEATGSDYTIKNYEWNQYFPAITSDNVSAENYSVTLSSTPGNYSLIYDTDHWKISQAISGTSYEFKTVGWLVNWENVTWTDGIRPTESEGALSWQIYEADVTTVSQTQLNTYTSLKNNTIVNDLNTKYGLSSSSYSTNADQNTTGTTKESIGLAGLTDNDKSTFFHSSYQGDPTGDGEYHYIQADLGEAQTAIYLYFHKRIQNGNNIPRTIKVSVSNDGTEFTDITTLNNYGDDYLSEKINFGNSYRHVRFTVTATNTSTKFFTASEFYVIPSNEVTDKGMTAALKARAVSDVEDDAAIMDYQNAYEEYMVLSDFEPAKLRAAELLSNVGKVGYPTSSAIVTSELQSVLSLESSVANYNTLIQKIDAFKAERTDISLPQDGKYYVIEAYYPTFTSPHNIYVHDNGDGTYKLRYNVQPANFTDAYVFTITPTGLTDPDGRATYTIANVLGGEKRNVSKAGWNEDLPLVATSDSNQYVYALAPITSVQAAFNLQSCFNNDRCTIKMGKQSSSPAADVVDGDISTNNTLNDVALANVWRIREVSAHELSVTNAGYATLYLDYATTIPEGVEVYTGSRSGDNLNLEAVSDNLPADEGVVVKADEGSYVFVKTNESVAKNNANELKGTVTTKEINGAAYVLSKPEGQSVGFYQAKMTGDGKWTNNANRAYLPAGNLNARVLTFNFDDNAETGISAVEIEEAAPANAAIYDLSGRRVQSAKSGLYIINGKKVIK